MFTCVELFIFMNNIRLKYVSLFTKTMFLSGGQFLMVIYVTSNQTFASNKTFILWMLIISDKRLAVSGSWNPGTSTFIQEGVVLTWH